MLLFLNVSVRHLLDQPLKKFFIRRLYFYLLSIHSCCNSNFGWQSLPYLLLTSMLHQENSFFVKNNFQCLLFYEKRNSIVAKLNQSVQCAFLDQVQTLHDINKNAHQQVPEVNVHTHFSWVLNFSYPPGGMGCVHHHYLVQMGALGYLRLPGWGSAFSGSPSCVPIGVCDPLIVFCASVC